MFVQADTIMTAPRIDQEVLDDVVLRGFDRKAVVEALKTRSQSKVQLFSVGFPLSAGIHDDNHPNNSSHAINLHNSVS